MPDLITLDELADTLPTVAARNDAARLISAASAAVEGYCGRSFGRVVGAVERLSGDGQPFLWLDRTPVASIASVTIHGEAITDYGFDAESGKLWRGDGYRNPRWTVGWPLGSNNVVVTYTAGYDPIPADVKQAVILTCKWLDESRATSGSLQSEKIGDYSYTVMPKAQAAAMLPDEAARLLAHRVRAVVA